MLPAPLIALVLSAVSSTWPQAQGAEADPTGPTGSAEAASHVTALPPHELFRRSLSDGAGDIFLLAQPYNALLDHDEFKPETFRASHVASTPGGKADTLLPPHPISSHGYAWDYDLRIPLAFYDPSGQWVKPGVYGAVCVQQDIAPTLAEILATPAPDRSEGRALSEALRPRSETKGKRPKIVAVIVQDQMGLQYFAAHPGKAKFIRRMLAQSASFSQAQVGHVDVETAVGHAAIATGGYARDHGITGNSYWHPGLRTSSPVYQAKLTQTETSEAFPLLYMAPTLADVWQQESGGKAVILAMVAAARASVSLGGHGAMFHGGKKNAVVYFSEHGPHRGEYTTDEAFYTLPAAMRGKSVKAQAEAFQKEQGGSWYGNRLVKKDGQLDLAIVRASPALVRFESTLLENAVSELKLGSNGSTDLVFVNFKGSDYCGHLFGYESEECGEVLEAIDHAVASLVAKLTSAASGELVVAFTADHGAAPIAELSGGVRYDRQRLLDDLRRTFDQPKGAAAETAGAKSSASAIAGIASSQLWLNQAVLQRNGFTVADVTAYLKAYEVPMAVPWNMLAAKWLAAGRPASRPFFYDVVSRSELEAEASSGTARPSAAR